MKKTLVAILALSGMAMADYTADNASGILYRDANGDFATMGGVTLSGSTLTFEDTFTTNTGAQDRIEIAMGVLIDMSKIGTLTTNGKVVTTAQGTAMGIGMTPSKQVATVWGDAVPWNNQYAATLPSEGLVTVVFSTSNTGSLYMFENQSFGDYAGWGWSGLKGSCAGLNSLTMGADFKDAIVAVGVWSTPTIANTTGNKAALQASFDQINSTLRATLPVPEPATATLSLLALAGLAARRRRH